MGDNSEINILISNIVEEKQYSHCRICLKCIEDEHFARFQDGVAYSINKDFLVLSEVLFKIFGGQVCDNNIVGLDAVCSNCLHKALETLSFIRLYEENTLKLHRVFDNLNATLDVDIDIFNQDQVLYITCGEEESQLVFVQKDIEVQIPKPSVPFTCFPCKITFEEINELKDHNLNQHESYTCEKCTFTSKHESEIAEHEASLVMFNCKDCTQVRCTEDSLKEHDVAFHGQHVCQECGKSFKGLDKLLAHEEKHVVKSQCPKCGKVYVTKEFYTKHVKLCLEDRFDPHPMRSRIEKSLFCQECGKGYSTPGGLRVHMKFVHGDAKPHICEECGKKFTAPCYLKVHMVTHTKERNFPCDMCDRKFVSKEALLYHRRRHTGEKPYSCDVCSEKFVNASARAEHIKFKHIGPKLCCELCSRMFVTKNFLRLHMNKHHDPTNKLYIGRNNIPPNVPGEQNMRVRFTN